MSRGIHALERAVGPMYLTAIDGPSTRRMRHTQESPRYAQSNPSTIGPTTTTTTTAATATPARTIKTIRTMQRAPPSVETSVTPYAPCFRETQRRRGSVFWLPDQSMQPVLRALCFFRSAEHSSDRPPILAALALNRRTPSTVGGHPWSSPAHSEWQQDLRRPPR